jgi:hypothetical protein
MLHSVECALLRTIGALGVGVEGTVVGVDVAGTTVDVVVERSVGVTIGVIVSAIRSVGTAFGVDVDATASPFQRQQLLRSMFPLLSNSLGCRESFVHSAIDEQRTKRYHAGNATRLTTTTTPMIHRRLRMNIAPCTILAEGYRQRLIIDVAQCLRLS